MTVSDRAYRFIAGGDPAKPPLVLLHGSGGNEHDFVQIAQELVSGSPFIGMRPITRIFVCSIFTSTFQESEHPNRR